jgi:sucrose-6-phosphate hydrolase SacC (GH32 family)
VAAAVTAVAGVFAARVGEPVPPRASPVLLLRGEGRWESGPHGSGNVYAPYVLFEGGTYRMWYGGQGEDGHDRILHAESKDGTHWDRKGVAVEDATANHVNDPSVVKVNGQYFMFFTRAAEGVVDEVALATSDDGLKWTMRGTVLSRGKTGEWDALSVGRPSVVFEDGLFRMWYDGRKDLPVGAPAEGVPKSPTSTRSVGYATSKDGLHWAKYEKNPVFGHDAGGVDVRKIGKQYVMVYESHEGTKLATSRDGIVWAGHGLWLAKSGEALDAAGHVTPSLLVVPGRQDVLVFFGAAAAGTWDHNAVAVYAVPLARVNDPGDANR